MNERIREFAEHARKKPLGDSWCYANAAEFEQRFAELIVLECCKVSDNIEPLELPWKTSKFIKLHFGVEE